MQPFDDVLEARAKILAYFGESRRLDETIAKFARAAAANAVVEGLERRREQLGHAASDLMLDYYCAAERAAGRDPYGVAEGETCHAD